MRPASHNGAQDHFEAVIVGSGFGGSVTAYRLAEAGKRVCLLERGKPYPPGSFPRSPLGFSQNFWDPSKGLYGMFNVWRFSGIGSHPGAAGPRSHPVPPYRRPPGLPVA